MAMDASISTADLPADQYISEIDQLKRRHQAATAAIARAKAQLAGAEDGLAEIEAAIAAVKE